MNALTDLPGLTFSREMHFRIKGVESLGRLLVGGIEECKSEAKRGFWVCYWSLSNIHPEKGKIYGVDPLDALLNCIQFIIRLIEHHKEVGYEVWWNTEGDVGGLVPPVEGIG